MSSGRDEEPEDVHVTDSVQGTGPLSHAIFRVARLHKMFAGQLLRETGLYPGQELLMMRLWDEGPQRQIDLVKALDSDAPTIARSIARLERAGFVRRTPHANDKRSSLVEATPASMSLRRAVHDVWTRLEALTVAEMSVEYRDTTLAGLLAVEANLQAAEQLLPAAVTNPRPDVWLATTPDAS